MTTPDSASPGPEHARLPAEPTVRVPRPGLPAPAKPAEDPAEPNSPPPVQPGDETTIGLPKPAPEVRQRTLQFGKPTPVKVTVSARPRQRRQHRMWPWIAAVILALVVLGVILLVMLLRGATIDGDTDVVGWGRTMASACATTMAVWAARQHF